MKTPTYSSWKDRIKISLITYFDTLPIGYSSAYSLDKVRFLNSGKVSETLPSDGLVQKARGLGLPDHFQNYWLSDFHGTTSRKGPCMFLWASI